MPSHPSGKQQGQAVPGVAAADPAEGPASGCGGPKARTVAADVKGFGRFVPAIEQAFAGADWSGVRDELQWGQWQIPYKRVVGPYDAEFWGGGKKG